MYDRKRHAASKTDAYIFNQLIPYIGNKRKLLGLIGDAIKLTGTDPDDSDFIDLFSGSGVVARFAKKAGFRVVANDWEPYSEQINKCHIGMNSAPEFIDGTSYERTLERLNALLPLEGWISRHLCPRDDDHPDVKTERMFYTRENGMKIDAIREKIHEWLSSGTISETQAAALIAPLLYQASYVSNTSGVFKGFHNGWGGQTKTALYRIKSKLTLKPAAFHDNGKHNEVFREDAVDIASSYGGRNSIAYIDPPYNQHPYGSNYHVLNSIALWDKPELSEKISGRDKAAIREDWKTKRRSKYNYKNEALPEYERLLKYARQKWLLTSYSTDGIIALQDIVRTACECGATQVVIQPYKRYRVSSQRFSKKPINVEFVLVTKKGAKGGKKPRETVEEILKVESDTLNSHPETRPASEH